MANKSTAGWSDELSARLEALWNEKLSASKIADALYVEFRFTISRSAVIGKARRMKLAERHQSPLAHMTPEERVQYRRDRHARLRRRDGIPERGAAKRSPPPDYVSIHDQNIPTEQRKRLFDLENHHCRWPVGEVGGPDFFFCGSPEANMREGRSYCPAHAWRGTTLNTFNKKAA